MRWIGQAENLLLCTEHLHQGEAAWLSRLALVNGRLAEFEGKSEKIARVCRMDELCRAAIAADSTDAMAHVLLGVLNYRLCKLSCLERLLANTFVGRLPNATLEDSESYLRRAIQLQDPSVCSHYAQQYKGKAAACLEDLEDRLLAVENPWHDDLGEF